MNHFNWLSPLLADPWRFCLGNQTSLPREREREREDESGSAAISPLHLLLHPFWLVFLPIYSSLLYLSKLEGIWPLHETAGI